MNNGPLPIPTILPHLLAKILKNCHQPELKNSYREERTRVYFLLIASFPSKNFMLPLASLVTQTVKNLLAVWETQV